MAWAMELVDSLYLNDVNIDRIYLFRQHAQVRRWGGWHGSGRFRQGSFMTVSRRTLISALAPA
ncbi:hypothetical protein, partial [Delftia acidovorans]|uniref:hypothetical protein n=1 Tax=Delftia acidovorans TaxID=80866 RepID=UPI0035A03F5E